MSMTPDLFLLLRGLTREAGHWGPFIQELNHQFPKADIITPDLPGCGTRFKDKSSTSIADTVEQLRPLYKPYLKNKTVCVVALSLGGMVTLEWMTRYPEDFHSAVLMSTSIRNISPLHHRLQPRNYLKLLHAVLRFSNPVVKERLIHELTSNTRPINLKVINDWIAIAQQHPVSRINAFRQLWSAAKFNIKKDKPTIPILLLAGEKDQLVNPDCSSQLAQYWHLPLRLNPDSGHDLPLDVPQWCCQQISDWLYER